MPMNTDVFGTMEALIRRNYQAMLPAAEMIPDAEVVIRDDVIYSSCLGFPDPDITHACRLRATPATAPALLDEIVAYFRARDLPPIIFISDACTPDDWDRRLHAAGFEKPHTEYWMGLEDLDKLWGASPARDVEVRVVDKSGAMPFAEVYVQAFDIPIEFAPKMAELQEQFIGVPDTYHYVAYVKDRPVGVCSLICAGNLAIVGSAGIVRMARGSRVFSSLAHRLQQDAREHNLTHAITQIQDKAKFGRLLRISGFKPLFARDCYIKND